MLQIIRFLQIILDGFFVHIVQAPDSLPLLKRLQEKITENLMVQRGMEQLRGPLEPFLKLADSPGSAGDVAPRKSDTRHLPSRLMTLKVYQIEQITI
jgi:hypothetical protein